MKWLKIMVDTQDIPDTCAALSAIGIDGVEVEDFEEFTDFLEHNRAYWDYVDQQLLRSKHNLSRVIFYLCDTPDGHAALDEATAALSARQSPVNLQVLLVDEADWQDSWQQYYRPTPIGERLLILPEWEPAPQTDRVIFINNPGMSFGTGTHASTRLALECVEKTVRAGDSVLDLGCGSGILAICALLLGAARAVGVDIDPMAAEISRKNAERNKVSAYTAYAGDLLSDDALVEKLHKNALSDSSDSACGYDAIYMNIVADVIIALGQTARRLLKPDGVLIVSGIIDERRDEVLCSLTKSGFLLAETLEFGGWVAAKLRPNR